MSRLVDAKRLDDEASAGWTTYGTPGVASRNAAHFSFAARRGAWHFPNSENATHMRNVGVILRALLPRRRFR
jgi:hypothetical protein